MKKVFLRALAFSLCLVFSYAFLHTAAEAKTQKTSSYYVVKTSTLYDTTTSKKRKITTIPVNTKLSTTSSKSSSMYKVTYKGRTGYVYKSNLADKAKPVTKYTVKTSNLYSSNTSKSKILASVPVNVKLSTTSPVSDKMYQVKYKGKTGYVYRGNTGDKPKAVEKYTVKTSNLYSSNSSKSNIITSIPVNHKLTTTSPVSDNMYQVKINGKTGYVYRGNLGDKPKAIDKYVVKTTNLYDSYKGNKKTIASIPLNNKLTTTSPVSDNMYKVTYKGKTGYVYRADLGDKAKPITKYVVKKSNLYDSTSSDKRIITSIDINNKVTTTSPENSSMYQVTYNGRTGFVYRSNLGDNFVSYTNKYNTSQITRYDISRIPFQEKNSQYRMPNFNADEIANIPSAKRNSDSEAPIDLDVWDSWPLQNPDGTVAEYNGYHVVFALAGKPRTNETFIYMFYQKIGETSIDSWKNAGRVFTDADKFNANDPILKHQTEEWSGSAALIDNKIRLFYTDFSGSMALGGTGDSKQTLTTAQVNVGLQDESLTIDGVQDHKSIFDGDGKIYQNVSQFHDEGMFSSGDNHTLRDPHYVEDNGRKYLVFEGNTGSDNGYHGDLSLYNKAFYGGDDYYFQSEFQRIMSSPKKKLATLANGALGIIEINDDFTLKKVMNPLITSNLVTDEIERANVFKLKDKWYLFTDTRGAKMGVDNISPNMIYMLGYVSDSLTGPYTPLNDTGLVIASDEDFNSRTFTYSHYALLPKNPNDNNVVVTSYMTNRGASSINHSTFAPSFLLNIDGDKTYVRQHDILEQGQLTTDTPTGANESNYSGN